MILNAVSMVVLELYDIRTIVRKIESAEWDELVIHGA